MAAARDEVIDLDDPAQVSGPTITASPTVIDIDEPEPEKKWDWEHPTLPGEAAKRWLASKVSPETKEALRARTEAAMAGTDARNDPRVQQQMVQEASKIQGAGPVYGLVHSGATTAQALLKEAPYVMGVPGMAAQFAKSMGDRAQGKGALQRLSQATRDADEEERTRQLQLQALATAKRLASEKK